MRLTTLMLPLVFTALASNSFAGTQITLSNSFESEALAIDVEKSSGIANSIGYSPALRTPEINGSVELNASASDTSGTIDASLEIIAGAGKKYGGNLGATVKASIDISDITLERTTAPAEGDTPLEVGFSVIVDMHFGSPKNGTNGVIASLAETRYDAANPTAPTFESFQNTSGYGAGRASGVAGLIGVSTVGFDAKVIEDEIIGDDRHVAVRLASKVSVHNGELFGLIASIIVATSVAENEQAAASDVSASFRDGINFSIPEGYALVSPSRSLGLPDSVASQRIDPVSGLWWNPHRPGHGYSITRSGSQLVVVIYTYDSVGNPTWYLSSAEYDGSGTWAAPLGLYTWTAENKPDQAEFGFVSITFKNSYLAEMNIASTFIFENEEIERFGATGAGSKASQSGLWYDPSRPGYGITLDRQSGADIVVLYFYDKFGFPRWVLASGTDLAAGANADAFIGPCSGCSYSESEAQHAGSLAFVFEGALPRFSTDLALPAPLEGIWQTQAASFSQLSN